MSATLFESTGGPARLAGMTFSYALVFIMLVGGASLYAWIMAMAANWANHKRMFIVRMLILLWAWAHPALLALPLLLFPSLSSLSFRSSESRTATQVVFVFMALSVVVWAWILLTQVEKKRGGGNRR